MISPWIFFALIAGLASNASNFFSRYLLKDGQDSAIFAWYFEFVRFVAFGFMAFFDFYVNFNIWPIFLLLAMGIVELISVYIYMKMHAYNHLSISAIASRTRLIWVPVFAFLFLREHFPIEVYLGMAVLLVGLLVATSPHKLFLDKGLWYAYGSAFLIGINATQMKMNTPFASSSMLLVFLSAPTAFAMPFLIKKSKAKIMHFFKHNLLAKLGAAIVNIVSIYFFAVALKTGPVSLINAIYQATMIFAVLAGIFILGEKEDVVRKLVGTGIALFGILILSFVGI